MWAYKDETFEDLFNKYASQGWSVINVGFDQSANIRKAVLEREKNRQMKEYKIIKKSFWKKDDVFEDALNQFSREGWEVKSAIGDNHGNFSKVILERDKNRM